MFVPDPGRRRLIPGPNLLIADLASRPGNYCIMLAITA